MSSIRSGMRPMSAKAPSQTRQLIAKTFNEKSNTNSVDNVAKIWTAFGKFISKTLKTGKGVGIPKFGNFTFTPANVDLAGSTNPDKRDLQIREPIFQVAKDFVLGQPVKCGIVHDNGALRPFEIKGTSGVVPKVRVNFTEIGYYAGVSKEDAKHGCDIVIRDLSDKVKSGQSTTLLIPNVGNFISKGGVAGIKFNTDVVEESKGKTTKAHFIGKLFASSVNRANLDILDQKVSQGIRTRPANFDNTNQRIPVVALHDNTITVTAEAENWMKRNLGLTLGNGTLTDNKSTTSHRKMKRTYSARPGFRSTHSEKAESIRSGNIPNHFATKTLEQRLEQQEEPIFKIRDTSNKRRPMSAYSGTSKLSKASSVKSAASRVPKISRAQAIIYCQRVAQKAVLDHVRSLKMSARDHLTPSEIQSILQNAGIGMDIATLRGFLSHLDFSPHGKSCSILDLIRRCKKWSESTQTPSMAITSTQAPVPIASIEELVTKCRDCFYKSGKNIKEVFDFGCDQKLEIDEEAFVFLCKKFCYPAVNEAESRYIFQACHKNLGGNMLFMDFKNIFGSIAPKNNFYIEGLKLVRDWMYKNGLTSDQAFDSLVGNRERISLGEFDTQMKRLFNLTAPEVESIFAAIDENKDGFIDREEWLDKVYEDSANPLQLLREIVNEHNLSSDDLLFKMNLRIWDDPMNFAQFSKALRTLDSSLTEVQLKAMAKSMKNPKNLVEVPTLIKNLVGKDYETVDFRDKLYKRLYNEILGASNSSRREKLQQLMVKYDDQNDGTIVAQDMVKALNGVCKNVTESDIERFVRFLDKDPRGRIDYTQFINNLEQVKDHNPFKNLVSRIKAFMAQNNQNAEGFMKRLVMGETQSSHHAVEETGMDKERKVSVDYFIKFLKNKVDKKRNTDELRKYAELIDVDNDGYISIHDLQSCLGNLNNETFYKNSGQTLIGTFKTILTEREKFFPKEALPDDKACEVVQKIKDALVAKGISFRELFARLDVNNDEFLTYTEFAENMDNIVKLSPLVKEQLFALMDINKIGMVDYEAFLTVMKKTPIQVKTIRVSDNFNWEGEMVEKIKEWIISEGITIEEAFKAFDRDFDGFIDINDLRWILTNILRVGDKSTIMESKLQRLFKLLDFHKSGHIQKCDIQRLVENDNPYLSTGKLSNAKFMVGSDTFDWKNNAIQQIGIEMSKNPNFLSLRDSFNAASKKLGKVRYRDFREFMEETNALKGFNLTDQLMQQLFAELDPHRKGFLTESDWNTAFGGFNYFEQIVVELENLIACSFADIDSAYEYFLVTGGNKNITYSTFQKAVNGLRGSQLKEREMRYLWRYFAEDKSILDYDKFNTVFYNLTFNGTSSLRKTGKSLKTATLVSQTASSSKWSKDIMEKFRKFLKGSNMSLKEVFAKFDTNGDGYITPLEFRHAVRSLNLNLTALEIDEIIKVVDRNADGMIDWQEFSTKFKTKQNEILIETRAQNKLAKLKEQMTLHMKNPQNAFALFDQNKADKLSFANFQALIEELAKLSEEPIPPFGIVKDLFDEINVFKDGHIEKKEWDMAFIRVQEGDKRFSLKKMPENLAKYEVSRDARIIMDAIRKNRKFLMEKFVQCSPDGNFVSFEDAKEVIRSIQRGKQIEDDQYRIIFKDALRENDMVEFQRLKHSVPGMA